MRATGKGNPPIFIVGLPRSGSTLWQNIIVKNRNVLRLAEMLFLSPLKHDFRYFLRTRVGSLSDRSNIEKMVDLILSKRPIRGITSSFWRFENIATVRDPKFKESLVEGIIGSDRSLGSIFRVILEELSRYSGCDRVSVAFPVYPNYIPNLLEWCPGCKVLHVTRDPRATAISKTNDPGGTARLLRTYPRLKWLIRKCMMILVVIQYNWTSRLHVKYEEIPNYKLFRYEDLLATPDVVIRELCDFIEVDYASEMHFPAEDLSSRSSVTGKQYQGISKGPASHWRKIITPFEEFFVTILTMRSMRRFGFYPEKHPVYGDYSQKTVRVRQ